MIPRIPAKADHYSAEFSAIILTQLNFLTFLKIYGHVYSSLLFF